MSLSMIQSLSQVRDSMSYSVEYFNDNNPDGFIMFDHSSIEESQVRTALGWLWSFPLNRIVVRDNDNGHIVYDKKSDEPDLRVFKPFGEKKPEDGPLIFKTPLEI